MDAISANLLLGFITTCIIIELTPGPNMAYLAIISITEGKKSGFFTTLGIALGLLTIGIAAALGIATLITSSPALYQALRVGGILYLLWLAWDGWKTEEKDPDIKQDIYTQNIKNFRRGLVTNLLNPKAGLFYIAVLPTFISSSSPIAAQAIGLTCLYVFIATTIHIMIVMLAGTARNFLQDTHKRMIVRRILSALLALIALWFAWSTQSGG